MDRRNKPVQGAGFAHRGRDLGRGFGQNADFFVFEDAGRHRLHHQNTLQHAPVYEWNTQKGLKGIFSRFLEVLEARMVLHLFHRDRAHLFRHQPGQTLVHRHAQSANALRPQAEGRGQHQIGPVRLQKIGRTHIRIESPGDQGHHIHEGFGGFAALLREVPNLLQG